MPPKHLTVEELRTRAKKELNEDPNQTEEDIVALRQWLIKQTHICGRTDGKTLLQFLRNCKFSLEKTKKKMDNFYTAKTLMSEYFSKIDPGATYMRNLLELGLVVPLGYDHEGRRIVLSKLSIACREKLTFEDCMRLTHVLTAYILSDEQTQICGITILADYSDIDTWLLAILTPTNLKNFVFCLQDCMPLRLQLLVPFNTGPIFDFLFGIGKVFLKKKLLKRFRFPGSKLSSLYSAVPADCLVTELGGTAGDLRTYIDKTINDVMSLRDYFLEDKNYCVDDSKRKGKLISEVDRFGMNGSFRKLDVD